MPTINNKYLKNENLDFEKTLQRLVEEDTSSESNSLSDETLKRVWQKLREQVELEGLPCTPDGDGIRHCLSNPANFERIQSMTKLDLSDTDLTFVPDEIALFTSLEVLNLANNQLNTLPSSITHLSSLKDLHLANNKFDQIPESVTCLTTLKKLNLYNNQLNQVSPSISRLENLENLNIASNKIAELPSSMGDLKKLQILFAHRNELHAIPESLSQRKNLKITTEGNRLGQQTPFPVAAQHEVELRNRKLNGRLDTQLKEFMLLNPGQPQPKSIGGLIGIYNLFIGYKDFKADA
jgi:Leucine-rich repeat (LRR) protein